MVFRDVIIKKIKEKIIKIVKVIIKEIIKIKKSYLKDSLSYSTCA